MAFDPQKHHRRSIRLPGYDYSKPGAYFITLVTQGRECLFGQVVAGEMQLSDMGRIADDHWRAIPDHFPNVELGTFAIMPNHIHGIIVIHPVGASQWDAPTGPRDQWDGASQRDGASANGPKRGSIGAIIGAYKMSVTRRVQRELNRTTLWQRNYYEHIIRDEQEHRRIHLYIEANPANWIRDDHHPLKT